MKIQWCVFFLLFGLLIVSCDDDDDDEMMENKITINILEPSDGQTITDCSEVHIHVVFEASDENHEIEVELHPEGDVDDKIIAFDEHSHDQKIDWEEDVNLCDYPSGTCFHLEVAACTDHDCEEKETAEAEFCLN